MTRRLLAILAVCALALSTMGASCGKRPPVVPPALTCPAGKHLVDGACVPDPPPTCPAGQHLEAGVCVLDVVSPLTCPAGPG
jgi:hypothetical protein